MDPSFVEDGDELDLPHSATVQFDNAEIGAIAHLYRGEVYRSTIWRTRLDNTTNWSVVTLGIALSATYATPTASPLPLLLVGILISMFLILEARRYRYFNVWRARCRMIETQFYAPMLMRTRRPERGEWQDVLADDYVRPDYHIGFWRAMGRRLRRNYMWIFTFQAIAYAGKITIHPVAVQSWSDFLSRMAVGPISGAFLLLFGILFHGAWISLAVWTYREDRKAHALRDGVSGMG